MVSTRESVAIQLEQVYYLTKDAKERAVLIKNQSVTEARYNSNDERVMNAW